MLKRARQSLCGVCLMIFFGVTAPAAAQSADQSLALSQSIAGSDITYTIEVNNIGPNAAANAVITNAIPANTTFTPMTTPAGRTAAAPAPGGTGTITLTQASYPQGAVSAFTVTVTIDPGATPGTEIVDTATISSDTPDPAPAGNTKTVSHLVGPVTNLSVSTTRNLPVQIRPTAGDEFTWPVRRADH